MAIVALAGEARALRIAGERPRRPGFTVGNSPVSAAAPLVADIRQHHRLAAPAQRRTQIFRFDPVAGQFRPAIDGFVDVGATLRDIGATDIARRHDEMLRHADSARRHLFDRLLLRGRKRFGDQKLISRNDGTLATVRALRSGRPFYYLPDLNARRRDAVFAPFFGIAAATVSGLPRLAKMTGAVIMPCLTRMLPGGEGYEVSFEPPWDDYPGEDVAADTARMNAWIETAVRAMPAQYYWVHRRFKTRPEGEPRFY